MTASQAPRLHIAPSAPDTFGDLAAGLAADYGLSPDPWQRIVIDDWLAVHRGRWASLTCGLAVPRQNGKNAAIEIRELFGMVGRGEKILHTAHEVKTARKAFKRLQFFFGTQVNDPAAKYPELNALVTEVRNVNGQEAIYLKNGGSVEVVARSKNSGRGFTVDILVMDEAQEMSEEDLEALMPTTSASPKKDPQWIFTGTPPGPTANGEIFTRIRREALGGKSKRTSWHEWSADPSDDLDDREMWRRVNPATINGRLQMEVIEGERATFSDDGFGRERCGKWAAEEAVGEQRWKLTLEEWKLTEATVPKPGGSPQFFITVAKDLRSASIAVAALGQDRPHVELADHRTGAGWLAARIKELHERHPSARFGAYSAGPVKAWAPAFAEFGVELELLTQPETSSACGHLKHMIEVRGFTHAPDPIVNDSVSGAERRDLDGGGWVWDWRNSTSDPAPITALTGALWLLESHPTYDVEQSFW